MPTTDTHGTPQAAYESCIQYLNQQMNKQPQRLWISVGFVTEVNAGPPKTVVIDGRHLRYIETGTDPAVTDVMVILQTDPVTAVALGKLVCKTEFLGEFTVSARRPIQGKFTVSPDGVTFRYLDEPEPGAADPRVCNITNVTVVTGASSTHSTFTYSGNRGPVALLTDWDADTDYAAYVDSPDIYLAALPATAPGAGTDIGRTISTVSWDNGNGQWFATSWGPNGEVGKLTTGAGWTTLHTYGDAPGGPGGGTVTRPFGPILPTENGGFGAAIALQDYSSPNFAGHGGRRCSGTYYDPVGGHTAANVFGASQDLTDDGWQIGDRIDDAMIPIHGSADSEVTYLTNTGMSYVHDPAAAVPGVPAAFGCVAIPPGWGFANVQPSGNPGETIAAVMYPNGDENGGLVRVWRLSDIP